MRKLILAAMIFGLLELATTQGALAQAKADDPLEGLWQGYDGELRHVTKQLIALAEATPAEKFTWRPGPGVARRAKCTCTSRLPISIC